MTEIADTTAPYIVNGTFDLGSGKVTLVFSEYIDATPASQLGLDNVYIVNKTGVYTKEFVSLEGAKVTWTHVSLGGSSVHVRLTILRCIWKY